MTPEAFSAVGLSHSLRMSAMVGQRGAIGTVPSALRDVFNAPSSPGGSATARGTGRPDLDPPAYTPLPQAGERSIQGGRLLVSEVPVAAMRSSMRGSHAAQAAKHVGRIDLKLAQLDVCQQMASRLDVTASLELGRVCDALIVLRNAWAIGTLCGSSGSGMAIGIASKNHVRMSLEQTVHSTVQKVQQCACRLAHDAGFITSDAPPPDYRESLWGLHHGILKMKMLPV